MSEEELLIEQKKVGEGFGIEDEWSDRKELMARENACVKRSCWINAI